MKLLVNGKEKFLNVYQKHISIEELLTFLNIKSENIAIAVNENIVSKEEWTKPVIKEGDQIEIVQAVQGG